MLALHAEFEIWATKFLIDTTFSVGVGVLDLKTSVQVRPQWPIYTSEAIIWFTRVSGQLQIIPMRPILIRSYISSILASQNNFYLRTPSARPLTLCWPGRAGSCLKNTVSFYCWKQSIFFPEFPNLCSANCPLQLQTIYFFPENLGLMLTTIFGEIILVL